MPENIRDEIISMKHIIPYIKRHVKSELPYCLYSFQGLTTSARLWITLSRNINLPLELNHVNTISIAIMKNKPKIIRENHIECSNNQLHAM